MTKSKITPHVEIYMYISFLNIKNIYSCMKKVTGVYDAMCILCTFLSSKRGFCKTYEFVIFYVKHMLKVYLTYQSCDFICVECMSYSE